MTGVIYCYTSPSGKKYIGQTYEELKRKARWKNMKYAYGGGLKIENARKKYGPEKFRYEILETLEARTKEELSNLLNIREIYWIDKFDTFKNGYNSTSGGKFTYSEKRSISKMGFKHSENTKKYLSEINKKRRLEHYYPSGKNLEKAHTNACIQILQYDLYGNFIKVWNSASDAAKSLDIDASSIRKCCRGNKSQAFHFIWINYDGGEIKNKIATNFSKETIKKLLRKSGKGTPVLQYTLNDQFIKEYKSCRDASIYICGTNRIENNINKCCRNKIKTAAGFKWKYKYDN